MTPPSDQQDFGPCASFATLERRAALLRTLREFFYRRGFMEVETPLLADEIIPELHIEPITVEEVGAMPTARRGHVETWSNMATQSSGHGTPTSVPSQRLNKLWLQASPELHMKRLLAAGAEAIFQVTRSFRAGELGRLHNPEFTLVEWYRRGDDMQAGIDLLDELMQATLRTPSARRTSYGEAFRRQFDLCPHTASAQAWGAVAKTSGINLPSGMDETDRDEWLNFLLATRIEPSLGADRPEIVYHYPASQASLARVVPGGLGYDVAERFELYYRGIELANGFHELTDAAEQRRRFEAVNAARVADGRPALPLPESLLAALAHGLPDCTGCALGFDRLAMLAVGAESIRDVMAFPWHDSP